eukprot:scaffold1357_cov214-Alexandrium_tamarense.AAC.2
MEHLQGHLQAIDERLSAVKRSRGRLSSCSRVGTIVDTPSPSLAQSVISRDPASTADPLMSHDPSPSPAKHHHTGSIRSQDPPAFPSPHSSLSLAPPLNNVGRSASRGATAVGLRSTEWSIQRRGAVGSTNPSGANPTQPAPLPPSHSRPTILTPSSPHFPEFWFHGRPTGTYNFGIEPAHFGTVDLLSLGVDDSFSTPILHAHRELMLRWEQGKGSIGPPLSKIANQSEWSRITNLKDYSSVIRWYNNLLKACAPFNITLMPFEAITLDRGYEGLSIPGVGY